MNSISLFASSVNVLIQSTSPPPPPPPISFLLSFCLGRAVTTHWISMAGPNLLMPYCMLLCQQHWVGERLRDQQAQGSASDSSREGRPPSLQKPPLPPSTSAWFLQTPCSKREALGECCDWHSIGLCIYHLQLYRCSEGSHNFLYIWSHGLNILNVEIFSPLVLISTQLLQQLVACCIQSNVMALWYTGKTFISVVFSVKFSVCICFSTGGAWDTNTRPGVCVAGLRGALC